MDELFRVNSPPKVNNEIKLTDDDEDIFSPNSSSTETKAPLDSVNIKPVIISPKKSEEPSYSSLSSPSINKVKLSQIFILKLFP